LPRRKIIVQSDPILANKGRNPLVTQDPDSIVISADPSKGRRMLAVTTAGFLLLLWGVVFSDELLGRAFSLLGALLTGGIAWFGRRGVLGREFFLQASKDGLHHPRIGHIPWSDVKSIETVHGGFYLETGLGIDVRERDELIARHPNAVMRLVMRVSKPSSSPFIFLPSKLLTDSPDLLKGKLETLAGRSF
jgi:hypothetical protein